MKQDANSVVFVVDDDASIREAIGSLIRSVGLRVESFATAQDFLQSKALDVPGCVVLLSLAYYSDRLACCQKERTSVGRRRIRRSARRPKKLSSVKSSGQKLGSS